MIILGLAGQAGAGKDTCADYLVERYDFVKFAFSDALYAEVQAAYGLEDQELLRDRATKEMRTERLRLDICTDVDFVDIAITALEALDDGNRTLGPLIRNRALSPRQVLQWWGTEYRRAQDPDYWLKKNDEWLESVRRLFPYPEQAPQCFVNTTCRFPNEQAWIHAKGGNVWHIRRGGHGAINAHVSETQLPLLEGERELYNNDTIERLYMGVDLLMSTSARFVRVEPMDETTQETTDAS